MLTIISGHLQQTNFRKELEELELTWASPSIIIGKHPVEAYNLSKQLCDLPPTSLVNIFHCLKNSKERLLLKYPENELHYEVIMAMMIEVCRAVERGIDITIVTTSDLLIYSALNGVRQAYERNEQNRETTFGITFEQLRLLFYDKQGDKLVVDIATDGRLKNPPPGYMDGFSTMAKTLIRPYGNFEFLYNLPNYKS